MDIYDRKNKVRREIYNEMLKKEQQKLSIKLYDRVRERMENKSHHHVQKSRALCKAQTVSELTLTPIKRALTKSRFELIFGHSPQMLTTRVVRKLYPRNTEHIHNKLQYDSNAHTSKAMRKRGIEKSNPCM